MSSFARFANRSIVRNSAPLTASQLRALVPSAYATDKHESRSARFTYIPTSAVIDGAPFFFFFFFFMNGCGRWNVRERAERDWCCPWRMRTAPMREAGKR